MVLKYDGVRLLLLWLNFLFLSFIEKIKVVRWGLKVRLLFLFNALRPQQLRLKMLSDKQSIQEVTHESPPHNSHVAALKLQGPPILPWNVFKR